MFSAETTGLIFTKILHDVVALVALFNLPHTRHYPVPFLNDRAICAWGVGNFAPFLPLNWLPWQRPLRYRKKKVGLIICHSVSTIRYKDCVNRFSGSWDTPEASSERIRYETKFGCHGNVPWGIGKNGPDQENLHANTFDLVKRSLKSVDTEIALLRVKKIKKLEMRGKA